MSDTDQKPYSNRDLRGASESAQNPSVRFAFQFQELLDCFLVIDQDANAARAWSRRVGALAILMVLVALLLASSETLIHHYMPAVAPYVGIVAGSLGIMGSLVGFYGLSDIAPRRTWLRKRLQTESLRLFHFKYIAARLPEILTASGNPDREAEYQRARLKAFEQLKRDVIGLSRAELDKLVRAPSKVSLDSYAPPSPSTGVPTESVAADDAFQAWREIRLDWQLIYAESKLSHTAAGTSATPKQIAGRFAFVSWACLLILVVLHAVHFAPPQWMVEFLPVAVIWTALIALAARAWEDGLQPHREVERYEQYAAHIRVSLARFAAAGTFAEKLEAARTFEAVSLEEMQVFIKTHAHSKYLL